MLQAIISGCFLLDFLTPVNRRINAVFFMEDIP
jgi:hypothetical protein